MVGTIMLDEGRAERARWPELLLALQKATQDEPDQSLRDHLEFVLEEWFDNLCTHARQLNQGECVSYSVRLLRLPDDRGWEFVLIDNGLPFDPTQHRQADTQATLEQRPIGQLGLHVSLQMAHSANYQRQDTHNVFTVLLKGRD
jgi:anti-sigma regulatory factor (Ser/Thr protein kinase)